MQHDEAVRAYLQQLQRYLVRLSPQQADDVLREIESHIFDVLDMQEASGQPIQIADVLGGFGEPKQLAAQYVTHITIGTPPPVGFRALNRVRQGASISLYWSMAIFGYLIAGIIALMAIARLFVPWSFGVWWGIGGQSVQISLVPHHAGSGELLSYWLVPVFAGIALALAWLTRKVLLLIKPHCQSNPAATLSR